MRKGDSLIKQSQSSLPLSVLVFTVFASEYFFFSFSESLESRFGGGGGGLIFCQSYLKLAKQTPLAIANDAGKFGDELSPFYVLNKI